MANNNKSLLQGSLIVAMPLIAVAAAYFFFPSNQQQRDDLLSWLGTTNHGELVEPGQSIADVSFATADGRQWQIGKNHKWKLVVADSGECGDACQAALYLSRQIHKLIPKRINHLERLYISQQSPSQAQQQRLTEEYPGVIALLDSNDQFQQLLDLTNVRLDNSANRDGFYYLIAPGGEMVLFYTPDHEYKQVIKDLKVLL